MSSDKLQQAVALIKSGDKKGGQNLLVDIVNSDPQNETAWLWLASVVSQDKSVFCLEKVLEINPNNMQAKQILEKLKAGEQIQPSPTNQTSVESIKSTPSTVQYYRRSWKAPIMGLLLMGLSGLIGIPILAAIYAFLMNVIPFLIVRIVLVLGYPLMCGAIIAQAAKTGKVRNLTLITCAGVFFGLFAEYTGWVIWMAIISKEINLLWEFFHPIDLAYLISIIAELGAWSFLNIEPTGWFLYLFWLVEAVIVVGLTAYMTHKGNADTPFCEESDAWAEKISNIGVFAPLENPEKFKKAFEQMGYSTFNQFAPAQTGARFTIVQLYECEECKNFFVLNIKDQTIKLDSKGKRREEYMPIISNLLVTSSVVAMIRSLMVKYTT